MMTNDTFRAWCDAIAPSRRGNARTIGRLLGLDRDTVAALQTGTTRKGSDAPVPRTVELACYAVSAAESALLTLPDDIALDLQPCITRQQRQRPGNVDPLSTA